MFFHYHNVLSIILYIHIIELKFYFTLYQEYNFAVYMVLNNILHVSHMLYIIMYILQYVMNDVLIHSTLYTYKHKAELVPSKIIEITIYLYLTEKYSSQNVTAIIKM